MYLIYIDESGKPNYTEKSDFVLSAVAINESSWISLNSQIHSLKVKYFPNLDPDEIEFHAYEIFSRKKIYRGMKQHVRFNLLLDIANLIKSNPFILFSIIFQKSKSWKKPDPNIWGFRLLFERICKYFDINNLDRFNNSLIPDYAILLIDSIADKFDMEIRKIIRSLFLDGTHYISNKYIIEDPIFVKSHFRNISQIADFVAYLTNRFYDLKKDIKDPSRKTKTTNNSDINVLTNKLFKIILPKFAVNSKGNNKGVGIKLFPK